MVLLSEQERILADEENLVDDAVEYAFTTSWATVKDYGVVTLTKAGLFCFKYSVKESTSTQAMQCRLKVGSLYVHITGAAITVVAGAPYTFYGCVYLAAGSYSVLFEGKQTTGAGGTIKVYNFQCGYANFNDLTGSAYAVYSGASAHNTAVRKTPIGNLSRTTLLIVVAAATAAAVTNMENPGDSFTNGVSVLVDGVQQTFARRYHDSDAGNLNGAWGVVVASVTAGADPEHSVTVATDNGATVAVISVVTCPWILGTTPDYPVTTYPFPVTLGFAQFSTLYVYLEPLHFDETKFIGVGKKRAVSHGAASDFYSSATGMGLVLFSHTFELVSVSNTALALNGLGGCISHVGVDVR